jgi:elongation factor G
MPEMWPFVDLFIKPRSARDHPDFIRALTRMAATDPAFDFETDDCTGYTTLRGGDDRYLKAKVAVLLRACPSGAEISALRPAYRETLIGETEVRHTHKRLTGGTGQYADVTLAIKPIPYDQAFRFESTIAGGLPRGFIDAIASALDCQKATGCLAGFPVIGVKATLVAARYHDADSSALAFAHAAAAAFRELRTTGLARILEPVAKITVQAPSEYADQIEADLRKRDAHPIAKSATEAGCIISAFPRMTMIIGYAEALADLSHGRANYDLRPECYRITDHAGPPPGLFPSAIGMRA